MRRSSLIRSALPAALILGISCARDASSPSLPTGPGAPSAQRSLSQRPGTCFTAATIQTLVRTMLGAGHPGLGQALAKLADDDRRRRERPDHLRRAGGGARSHRVPELATLVPTRRRPAGPDPGDDQRHPLLRGASARIRSSCFRVRRPQVVVATDGSSGLNIPGGSVTVPTILTITERSERAVGTRHEARPVPDVRHRVDLLVAADARRRWSPSASARRCRTTCSTDCDLATRPAPDSRSRRRPTRASSVVRARWHRRARCRTG